MFFFYVTSLGARGPELPLPRSPYGGSRRHSPTHPTRQRLATGLSLPRSGGTLRRTRTKKRVAQELSLPRSYFAAGGGHFRRIPPWKRRMSELLCGSWHRLVVKQLFLSNTPRLEAAFYSTDPKGNTPKRHSPTTLELFLPRWHSPT